MAEYAVVGSPYLGGDCGTCEGGNEVTGGGLYKDVARFGEAHIAVKVFNGLKFALLLVLFILAVMLIAGAGNDDMNKAFSSLTFVYLGVLGIEALGEGIIANVR